MKAVGSEVVEDIRPAHRPGTLSSDFIERVFNTLQAKLNNDRAGADKAVQSLKLLHEVRVVRGQNRLVCWNGKAPKVNSRYDSLVDGKVGSSRRTVKHQDASARRRLATKAEVASQFVSEKSVTRIE